MVNAALTSVTPCVGVWIETIGATGATGAFPSHPAWVCGLKPSWEAARAARPVTPCVGVWIETYSEHIANVQKGHTLRGCVD